MHPIIGKIIVNLVLCLICFISYSSQIFVIWPWYGSVLSIDLLKLLVPFNVLVFMLLWNYFLSVTVNPGEVPDSWAPNFDEDGFEVKKLTGRPRYCRVCEKYKPPRAHHCRQCDKCVLRMDHHCPWINNCVGHYNYGHFIRFLFYVDMACSYHLTMLTKRCFASMRGAYWEEPSSTEMIFIILNYITCIPVLLCVGGFSIYHFYCLSGNTTTIEGWEKDKAATMVRRGKIREVKFPYHLGSRKNIESVLGNNPLLWCWPTTTPGTGLKFRLAPGEVGEEVVWPPQDPSRAKEPEFQLPSSPWTYENGSVNPELQPGNSQILKRRKLSSRKGKAPANDAHGEESSHISSLPPYHPDYQYSEENGAVEYASSSNSTDDGYYYEEGVARIGGDEERAWTGHLRMRRGSEGYEVKTVDRETLLRRFIEDQVGEAGRYKTYVPEDDVASSDDDDVPLAQRISRTTVA